MANRFREKKTDEEPEVSAPQAAEAVAEPDTGGAEPDSEGAEADSAAGRTSGGKVQKAARGIGRVLGGDMLADRFVTRQIPLLLLCLVYLLLIIANRYRIESLSHEKQATEERINFLREQRIQMQKQYQQSVKMSQIAEDLKETGVGITAGPPYEI